MNAIDSPDLYADLGIPKDATPAAIKAAYRRRAKTAHPDAGGNADDFARLQRAYDVLSDPERRQRYDETGAFDERSADNIIAEALEVLAKLLDAIIEKEADPTTVDVMALLRRLIAEARRQPEQQLATLKRQAKGTAALQGRFAVKDGANVFEAMLAKRAADIAEVTARVERQMKVAAKAEEIVARFTYRQDKRAPAMIDPFAGLAGQMRFYNNQFTPGV